VQGGKDYSYLHFLWKEKKGDGIRERPAKEKIAKILFLNRRY
jgi:hypothetical protein